MRRLALSVLTACGLAILSACSGGTGLTTGSGSTTPTQLVFSNGQAQVNDFFVAPSSGSAVSVTAIAEVGSGPTTAVLPNTTFTWAARFVNPATDPPAVYMYNTGYNPNGNPAGDNGGGQTKSCAAPASTPAVPILYAAPGSVLPSVLPSGQSTQQVFVAPVAGVAAPYCLVLQATASPGNVIGSVTVVVSNSP